MNNRIQIEHTDWGCVMRLDGCSVQLVDCADGRVHAHTWVSDGRSPEAALELAQAALARTRAQGRRMIVTVGVEERRLRKVLRRWKMKPTALVMETKDED